MSKALVLRTCKADLTSLNGFKWPASGSVECPDWDPRPECGHGLHGLPWGTGNWSYLSAEADAIWQVVEVDEESCVPIDGDKVKFPKGNVIFSGRMAEAVTTVLCDPRAMKGAEQASSGDCSTAASSGDCSKAASSGDCSKAASSGDCSTAASCGDCSKAAAQGENTIAMAAGTGCTVSAGENGCFASAWYDEKLQRNRIKVGYVGGRGIKADTPYRLTADGRWEEAKS